MTGFLRKCSIGFACVVGMGWSLSAHAGVICSSSFSITKSARHASKHSAKKKARRSVGSAAQRRCERQRVVYMKRWSYRCRKRSRRYRCRAINRFRCCTALKKRTTTPIKRSTPRRYKPSPIRLAANHSRTRTFRPTLKRLPPRKTTLRTKRIRRRVAMAPKRHRTRKRLSRRLGKRWCSHRMVAKGYHRQKQARLARKEARKAARKQAHRKCKPSKTIWMGGWTYRCTKSRGVQLCRAEIAFKCCQ